jgi:hypothetical protein
MPLIGFSVEKSPPTKSAAPASDRTRTPSPLDLLQRLRSLRVLFHQIPPHLRATYLVVVFATFTSFVHRVTAQSILPLYASSRLGLTPKEVGFLFTVSGVAVFAMILPAGFIIARPTSRNRANAGSGLRFAHCRSRTNWVSRPGGCRRF